MRPISASNIIASAYLKCCSSSSGCYGCSRIQNNLTNHHFVRRGSSPEVKMSESKVRLQMVNVKYNYFRLHALLWHYWQSLFCHSGYVLFCDYRNSVTHHRQTTISLSFPNFPDFSLTNVMWNFHDFSLTNVMWNFHDFSLTNVMWNFLTYPCFVGERPPWALVHFTAGAYL